VPSFPAYPGHAEWQHSLLVYLPLLPVWCHQQRARYAGCGSRQGTGTPRCRRVLGPLGGHSSAHFGPRASSGCRWSPAWLVHCSCVPAAVPWALVCRSGTTRLSQPRAGNGCGHRAAASVVGRSPRNAAGCLGTSPRLFLLAVAKEEGSFPGRVKQAESEERL